MNWIASTVGACVVAAFLIGALLGSEFPRKRQDPEGNQTHADKLDYPSDTNQEASIAAIARAHIAHAKDADAARKFQSAHDTRTYRVNRRTAVGVGTYTFFTAVIVVFSIVQYGEIHRFNKKQRQFFADQIGIMRGQMAAMQGQADTMRG